MGKKRKKEMEMESGVEVRQKWRKKEGAAGIIDRGASEYWQGIGGRSLALAVYSHAPEGGMEEVGTGSGASVRKLTMGLIRPADDFPVESNWRVNRQFRKGLVYGRVASRASASSEF
jgi:hypothetical protein